MKNRILRGQAVLNSDVQIKCPEKAFTDVSIDDIAEICKNSHKRYENPFVIDSIEKSVTSKLCISDNYNAKLYNYPTGQHVTIYDKTITKRETSENFTRTYHNEDRTDEQREHCISVSMARTKNNIYNIARSYVWKWFVTFTFNRQKTDASDYDLVVKRLIKNLDNTKQRKCPNLKYLIVPELHFDGKNYHFHGLLTGCDELDFIFSGKFDKKGRLVFNVPSWTWGFTTATLVGDTTRASGYICKYVTKDTERYLYNKRRYFSNAKKTVAEKLVIDKYEFLEMYGDDISYMKDIYIEQAGQHVTYIEMPYNYNNKTDEKVINISEQTKLKLEVCKTVLDDIYKMRPYEYRYVQGNVKGWNEIGIQ